MTYNNVEKPTFLFYNFQKRLGRGFRNFEHFRNRFLYATRSNPVFNVVTDYNPVTYYADDEF